MPKTVVIGVVKSDKPDKTRRVEIPRLVRHPFYGKFIHKEIVIGDINNYVDKIPQHNLLTVTDQEIHN